MNFEQKHYSVGDPKAEETAHIHVVENLKEGCVVEIGVLLGHTSGLLSRANPSIQVFGIDPLIPDSCNKSLVGNEWAIKNNTIGCSNFTFIKDYSFNVVKSWNNPISYLFIDGSHLYNDVKQDFEQWYECVMPGGIISLHDSAMNRGGLYFWEGPSKLADELIFDDRLEYIKTICTLTFFRKK